MKKAHTPTTPPPRKKMPAEVFVKIWKGEMEGAKGFVKKWKNTLPEVKGTELENVVKFEEHYSGTIVMFTGIEIIDNIHIADDDTLLPCLVLSNCKISNCYVENSQIHSAYFIEGTEVESIRIIENSKIGYFLIARSFVQVLKLKNSKTTILRIEKQSKVRKLQVWHTLIQRIRVTDDSFIGHIFCQFSHQEPAHLLIDKSRIGFLDFDDSVYPEFTTFNLSDCKVNTILFSNFCNYGSIFFSDLKPLEVWDDSQDKDEEGPTVFRRGHRIKLNGGPTLHFTDSDLGKMQFISCDLSKFERFEFYNTKMLDVFAASSQMPIDEAFCLPNNEQNPLKIVEQKRLAYGQFKKIYEARGDVAGSLPYLAYEMEAYRQQLQMKGWWKNRGELFMLWMNKLSTDYGTSWQRGLAVIAIVMIFFYSVFCYLIGYRFENNSPDDVQRFWKLVSYAPYYLNPLRDLDSISLVKEEEFTPIARIWDFVSRIFVTYFVYQTIQAFRKLGKSSG